jgi:hypothetical protein
MRGRGHYGFMPERADQSTRSRTGLRLSGIIAGASLIAGTVSAAAVLAIDRPHRWGAGAWISDFAKSPGMAGIFALVAALIAFWGIQRQVTQSRRTLNHQQDVEQDRAWWTRFEWAAERAAPANPTDERLPWAAVVSTFDALASSARDDIQRRAVGAIMDVAARSAQPVPEGERVGDEPESPSSPQVLSALRAYVDSTADTPAQSTAVTARLYEAEVLQALTRLFSGSAMIRRGGAVADALVESGGHRVVVEIKGYSQPPGRGIGSRIENHVRYAMEASGGTQAVIIAPVEIRLTDAAYRDKITAVQWRGVEDDADLARAVGIPTSKDDKPSDR